MAKPKRPVSLELAMRGETSDIDVSTDGVAPTASPKPIATVEKLTVYVPRAAAKRLKQMALDHERRVNDFLQEGVDLMLAKYGQPSLNEFEQK